MKKIYIIGIDHVVSKTTYLYEYIKNKNVEVRYFTSDISDFSKKATEHNIIFLNYGWILSIFKILIFLICRRPSHVELYFSRIYLETFPALIFCKLLFIPVSLVSRGKDLRDHHEHRYIRKVLTKFICRNVNLILPKENSHIETLKTFNISSKTTIHEIYNGIPMKNFEENKFTSNDANFLFLNAFRKLRNVDILIKAFSLVNKKYPKSKLFLVGSSLDINFLPQEKEHEEGLFALIKKLELESAIQVFPFSPNPWKNLKGSIGFILPADVVWLNNALLEAMAHSIPPIISNVERASDIIKNNEEGLLIKTDEKALSDAMIFLIENPKKAKSMGEMARKKVILNFSSERVGKEIFQIYKEKLWKS